MSHLGDKLKDYRKKKVLSQQEMADILQVGYRSYQEIEKTGKISKAETMHRVMATLKMDTQEFADLVQTTEKQTEPVQNKYIALLEKYNQLLESKNKELIDRVQDLQVSLDQQSKMLQSLAVMQKAERSVVFEALSRLEKKKDYHEVWTIWDNKVAEVLREMSGQDNVASAARS